MATLTALVCRFRNQVALDFHFRKDALVTIKLIYRLKIKHMAIILAVAFLSSLQQMLA
jgi:3'-phosphoadenosine 5'-phosphosulfate sulfotransferase (PAPS reductase)/FAD synthetase